MHSPRFRPTRFRPTIPQGQGPGRTAFVVSEQPNFPCLQCNPARQYNQEAHNWLVLGHGYKSLQAWNTSPQTPPCSSAEGYLEWVFSNLQEQTSRFCPPTGKQASKCSKKLEQEVEGDRSRVVVFQDACMF